MGATPTPEEEATNVMGRLRIELCRRGPAARSSISESGPAAGIALPRWRPDLAALPRKSSYVLSELLGFDGEEFVETAYEVILQRPADPVGLHHYASLLRDGAISKVEILGNLRWSEEGMLRAVHVDGLLKPFTVRKWFRLRWVGPLIEWAYTLVRLPRLARHQAALSARTVNEARRTGQILNEVAENAEWHAEIVDHQTGDLRIELHELKEGMQTVSDEHAARLEKIKEGMQTVSDEHAARLEKIDDILLLEVVPSPDAVPARNIGLRARVDRLEKVSDDLATAIDARLRKLEDGVLDLQEVERRVISRIEARLGELRESGEVVQQRINERLDALEDACTRLSLRHSDLESSMRVPHGSSSLPELVPNLDALYAAFEESFRGSTELVKKRVAAYVGVIADAVSQDELILDIGCGRGEWLELLRDAGYRARGIDTNEVFVQTCRGRGLDVVHDDAFAALKQMPDTSVGGITSMHLVEHLGFESLIRLLDECHRVLRPGGVLILETPNPENVAVGSNWFYMDPTHRNPLPPGLLFWLTRSRGFSDVRVERLTESREVEVPDLLSHDIPGAAAINMVLEHFRAPVDYAVIGRRSA